MGLIQVAFCYMLDASRPAEYVWVWTGLDDPNGNMVCFNSLLISAPSQ